MAISYDSYDNQGGASSSSATIGSMNISGTNLTLVVCNMLRDNVAAGLPTVTATWNTTENLLLASTANNSWSSGTRFIVADMRYLNNPTATIDDLASTYSESINLYQSVGVLFTGANNGIGTTGNNSGSSTTPSSTIITASSTSINLACCVVRGSATITPTGGETTVLAGTTGTMGYWVGYKNSTGGSDTISLSSTVDDIWAVAMAEINEAVASDIVILRRRMEGS